MKSINMLSAFKLLTDQNDYYKALDIPAQITRLNALNKLLQENLKTSQCDVTIPKEMLISLLKKSQERLYSSITLLNHLESSVCYDDLDDFIVSLSSKGVSN